SLLEIKASAEDPKNYVFYDESAGIFFTVNSGKASIVATFTSDLVNSDNYDGGKYTIPNELTDSQTGKTYKVFSIQHLAFRNSSNAITGLVLPDYFRELTLYRSAFAGLKSLTEVEFNCSKATVTGPLFELVAEYDWDEKGNDDVAEENKLTDSDLYDLVNKALGSDASFNGALADLSDAQKEALAEYCDKNGYYFNRDKNFITPKTTSDIIENCYPLRSSNGELIIENEGSNNERVCIRFYSVYSDSNQVYIDEYDDKSFNFNSNLYMIANVNPISMIDYDGWEFSASVLEPNVTFNSVSVGIYSLEEKDHPITIDDYTHNFTTYDWEALGEGNVSILFKEVEVVNSENIVDGNGAINKSNTVILYKSPVESFSIGPAVTKIPDYLFYDTNVDAEDIMDAVKNATEIGKYAFVDCDRINEIDLSNVKRIGDYAFAACDGLEAVTIPENLAGLGNGAFTLCDNLDLVTFNATGCEVGGEPAPFSDSGVEKMVFGKDVNTVPSNAARDIDTLRDVIFLADPLTVNENAFWGSNGIENIETKTDNTLSNATIAEGNDALKYDDIKVSTHKHLYSETVHSPSCIAEGYTAEECTCGDITAKGKYNIVKKIPHTPDITPATAAGTEKPKYTEETCTEYGYYTHTCKVCGATWKSFEKDGFPEITNAQITKSEPTHKFDKKVGSGAADCENPAYDEYECVICGEKKRTATSPALGHDWIVKDIVDPTCLEQGYTVKHCERCGKDEKTDFVVALGHDYGEYVYNDNATVFTDGTETAYCRRCGDRDVRTRTGTRLNDTLRDSRLCFGKETYIYFNQEVEIAAEVCESTNRKLSVLPAGYRLAIYEGSEIIAYGEKRPDGSYAPSVSFNAGKINTERHFWARVIDVNGQVYKNSRGTLFEKELVIKVRTGIFDRILATVEMALYKMLPERVSQFFNLIPPSIKIDPRAF
ncbi:MAG: leucine-rich repeat domain-containing protein, partial [Clostridia bacterium]|nr:leucine-rich repeat domain-containing protein [Clostridia bacterium]